ncbi:MAG: hypothetical protein CMJ78_21195 [Planctomycetaceae bacterium]|nr:hypothetical protein [Planctomycetaceae bacterium]
MNRHQWILDRVLGVCTVLIAVILFASGCNDSDDSDPTANVNPFANVEINVALPAGYDLPEPWGPALDEWAARTGASYQLSEYELSPGKSIVSALNNLSPNVIVFPTNRAAELDNADLLAPMPKDIRKSEDLGWLDIYNGIREHVTNIDRKPTIVPAGSPVLVLYFRRDLLEAADLEPPTTWTEYQKLVDTVEEWGGGLPVVEPWGEDFRATMFLARSVSLVKHPAFFSTLFDIDSGEPLIATAGFEKALADSVETVKKLPKEVLEYSPSHCRQEIVMGRAAMAIALESGAGNPRMLFGPMSEATSETEAETKTVRLGISPLPGSQSVFNRTVSDFEEVRDKSANRATLTAFAGLSMGVTVVEESPKRAAAWNLLTSMVTEPDFSTVFKAGMRQLTRSSQGDLPDFWVGEELSPEAATQFITATEGSLRATQVVKELPVIGASKFRTALTTGITSAITGAEPPKDALSKVQASWQAICQEIGPEQIRDSYRRNIGLSALQE